MPPASCAPSGTSAGVPRPTATLPWTVPWPTVRRCTPRPRRQQTAARPLRIRTKPCGPSMPNTPVSAGSRPRPAHRPPASRATPWTTPATPAASVTGTPTACATTPPTSAGWCGTAPAGSGTTWPPSSALQTRCWIRWTRPALASVIPTTPPPSADTSRKAAPAGARRPFSRRPSTCPASPCCRSSSTGTGAC